MIAARPRPRLLAALRHATLALVLGVSVAAHADAPLRTDNADVPDQGNCKLEAGYEGGARARAISLQPACVPFGVVELGAGYARVRDDERTWSNAWSLQAKVPIVPKDDEDDRVALAAAIGAGRDTGLPGGGFQAAWLNVPLSLYSENERWRVHVNGGVLWQRDEARLFTWGVATEYEIGRATLLAETFRLEQGRARYNVGARYEIARGTSLYASAGQRFGEPHDWQLVAGVMLESPTFLKALSAR